MSIWQQIQEVSFNNYKTQEIFITLGLSLAIFIGFWLVHIFFANYMFKIILHYARKSKSELDDSILLAFNKPLRSFFIVLGFYAALKYALMGLPLNPSLVESITASLFTMFRVSIILLVAWGLFNLSSESSLWLERLGTRLGFNFDSIILPFLSKVLRFIIIALAFSIVANELGYDVNGFVAGLGLGGLAFALAAKDTIGNIFGGIVIITEKPFTIGDWIQTPSVEGTIEELTFRSTKIRTFAQGLVTVPNSTLANEPITNWSQMGKRRITFQLGVTYSTPKAKVEKCVNRIREMLKQHPEIHQETLLVYFDKFNDSSLDIFLYFFTQTTDWAEWLQVKEDINFRIMEILEQENVSIAFPSRSVYLENVNDEKASF